METLNHGQIIELLNRLKQSWNAANDKELKREFIFRDFKTAVEFIRKTAEIAKKANHHPDIFLHDYNKVLITLSTHKANGLTLLDFETAREIEKI